MPGRDRLIWGDRESQPRTKYTEPIMLIPRGSPRKNDKNGNLGPARLMFLPDQLEGDMKRKTDPFRRRYLQLLRQLNLAREAVAYQRDSLNRLGCEAARDRVCDFLTGFNWAINQLRNLK